MYSLAQFESNNRYMKQKHFIINTSWIPLCFIMYNILKQTLIHRILFLVSSICNCREYDWKNIKEINISLEFNCPLTLWIIIVRAFQPIAIGAHVYKKDNGVRVLPGFHLHLGREKQFRCNASLKNTSVVPVIEPMTVTSLLKWVDHLTLTPLNTGTYYIFSQG